MKTKLAIAILAIALGVVAVALLATLWRLRSVNLTVTRQEQQIQRQKWTRISECAAQADKLFSQFQDAFPEGVTLHDRVSHYNVVNERCYLLFVRDREAHSQSQRELWDAFEQRLVAHLTRSQSSLSTVGSKSVDAATFPAINVCITLASTWHSECHDRRRRIGGRCRCHLALLGTNRALGLDKP
jgi:hypothetical protein